MNIQTFHTNNQSMFIGLLNARDCPGTGILRPDNRTSILRQITERQQVNLLTVRVEEFLWMINLVIFKAQFLQLLACTIEITPRSHLNTNVNILRCTGNLYPVNMIKDQIASKGSQQYTRHGINYRI